MIWLGTAMGRLRKIGHKNDLMFWVIYTDLLYEFVEYTAKARIVS